MHIYMAAICVCAMHVNHVILQIIPVGIKLMQGTCLLGDTSSKYSELLDEEKQRQQSSQQRSNAAARNAALNTMSEKKAIIGE